MGLAKEKLITPKPATFLAVFAVFLLTLESEKAIFNFEAAVGIWVVAVTNLGLLEPYKDHNQLPYTN